MRRFLEPLVFTWLCLLSLGSATRAEAARCDMPEVDIKFASGEIPRSANQFAQQIREAILGVCEWWGATHNRPFHIVVDSSVGVSMALIPAWRGEIGRIIFPAGVVDRGRAATVHEVTHVFAPNANRFLAEGLAVYAHERLNGPHAYPNFGADIKVMARRYVDRADIRVLDGIATPSRLTSGKLDERETYIVAGSFVRFLITDFGLAKFRQLYGMTPLIPRTRTIASSQRWEGLYGLTIDELASKWRDSLTVR